jgi:hypothetical protein
MASFDDSFTNLSLLPPIDISRNLPARVLGGGVNFLAIPGNSKHFFFFFFFSKLKNAPRGQSFFQILIFVCELGTQLFLRDLAENSERIMPSIKATLLAHRRMYSARTKINLVTSISCSFRYWLKKRRMVKSR